MNRLNADGHDESQYLPRKWFNPKTGKDEPFPIVNATREAKGDIQRNADDKLECATWMPIILNRKITQDGKPWLDDDMLHTCKRAERAILSGLSALGIPTIRNFMSGDMSTVKLTPKDPFLMLLTGMLPVYSTALLWVICDERNRGNIPLALKIFPTIAQAIEHAKKILDDLQDVAHSGIVASPQPRPESARKDIP